MSDLFRSALGYLSNSGPAPSSGGGSAAPQGAMGHHHGGYSSASGGPSDDTNAVGEVIAFSVKEQRRNVKILKLIAEGGFSYVFRGVDLQSGDPVAVKKILAPDPEAKKGVEIEVEFMRQFQHEHIVQFYGTFMKSSGKNLQEHYLGMEYCPVQLPTPPFRLVHTTQVFAQTCKAIKYLHEFGIIHRDIKLENLLIGSDGLVKLVDFGSATMDKIYPTPDWSMNKRTIVEEQIASKTTPMYRAPEMLDLWSNHPIDEHVDIWALGCLLFALNFGQHPFQDSNKLAIVNANYSFPKNVSDSGPIVTVIRGLLKVNPSERLSFGQIFEVLVSIAESEGVSLKAQLPFKAASSPNVTGGSGIINPLGSAAVIPPSNTPLSQFPQQSQQAGNNGGGGGSLFSSLKGGAASLLKNIKEQSQQYLAPVVPPSSSNNSSTNNVQAPARPTAAPQVNRPPPRPSPPSPLMQRKDGREAGNGHIEFENREYEALQQQHQQNHKPHRPAPPKPPPPSILTKSKEPQPPEPPKIANLLDMSFDGGESTSQGSESSVPMNNYNSSQPVTNADLLGDLFGASSANPYGSSNISSSNAMKAEDLLWGSGAENVGQSQNTRNNMKNEPDLLGGTTDPFASLLGKSVPSSVPSSRPNNPLDGFPAFGSSQPYLQPSNTSMPASASFQNLNSQQRGGIPNIGGMGAGLLETGTSRIPKNSSSPNLLSDLILDDIIGPSGGMTKMSVGPTGSSANKSNPSLNQPAPSVPPLSQQQNLANNQRPNYNRHQIFDPPAAAGGTNKTQILNDVFADILNSQGFAACNKNDQGKTINDLRKIELLADPNMDPTQLKVNEWREGKKKNIRALLSSLHTVTWEGCHWEETNMSQMITPAQVKKTYRKACLAIHPDKQMGQDWEDLAKFIFVELNEAWAAFEESQQGGI